MLEITIGFCVSPLFIATYYVKGTALKSLQLPDVIKVIGRFRRIGWCYLFGV